MSKMTDAALKRKASTSSFPISLDDIDFSSPMKKIIIDYYAGVGEADAKAAYDKKCGMIISANTLLTDDNGR